MAESTEKVATPHAKGEGCKKVVIGKDVCHISFELEGKKKDVHRAVIVTVDTARGETLALELSKDNEIIGIDLFAPGMKPCQPIWQHNMEETEEKKNDDKE